MNKLFLTVALAFITSMASAQFSVLTTFNEGVDSTWNITDKLGIGYQVNDKLLVAVTKDGDDAYELLGRYDVHEGLWATCIYNSYEDELAEIKDRLDIGVGYSYCLWKALNIEPYFTMPLSKNDDGEREGEFKLGVSYKF